MSARCEKPTCRGPLDPVTDAIGRVIWVCLWCERKRKRQCRSCRRRTPSRRHTWCAACGRERTLERERLKDRARYAKRRAAVLAHHRERQAIPAIREHKRRYMVAYRASHPRDGLDRAYQRAYMAQRRSDPVYRAKQNARKRELRAMRKQQRQERAA